MSKRTRKRAGLAAGANPETDTLSRKHCHHDTPTARIKIYRGKIENALIVTPIGLADIPDDVWYSLQNLSADLYGGHNPPMPATFSWGDVRGTRHVLVISRGGEA